jgi:tRNA pseudouridine38-40 synthase
MRNLLLTLRFDGRDFSGGQVQKNAPTVMQTLQDAMQAVLGERGEVKGCSRTDSGVHAKNYYVSFLTETAIGCDHLPAAFNTRLPASVAVTACREVAPDFHARYSALGKRYIYRILNAPVRDPFWEGFAWHCRGTLDARLMDAEAKAFLGPHDFSAFCASGCGTADKFRTITRAEVCREGDMLLFAVEGDGFLYHMVRIMAGTLVDVARGVIAPGATAGILEGGDRNRAGITAPACGLMLDDVFYGFQPQVNAD